MLVILFVVSVAAFAISAVAGGGASLVVVPLLSRVVRTAAVPAALAIGTSASSVSRIVAFSRSIHWGIVACFVPTAVPMAVLGAMLLRFLNPAYLQVVMALFLIGNVPLLLNPGRPAPARRASRGGIALVGAAAGFLSGLTGAVGVLFNRFYLGHDLDKEGIVATRATNEVLIHLIKLVVYARLGLLDRQALLAGAIVGVAAVAASFALRPVLQFISQATFARIGYGTMIASGLFLLGDSLWRVVRDDGIGLDARPVVSGVDATLHWRNASVAIEINYDEGLEIELSSDERELSAAQRALVTAHNPGGARVLIEQVFTLHGRSYEAYYLRAGRLLRKIEFDENATILEEETSSARPRLGREVVVARFPTSAGQP